MDTAEDPRFRVAEQALVDLHERIQQGHIKAQFDRKGALSAIETGQGALKQLKYTYAEPDQLVEMDQFGTLEQAVDELEQALGGEGFHEAIEEDALAVARARWTIDTLQSLEDRLFLDGNEAETAVDVRPGRVLSVREHPSGEIQVTRVAAGRSVPVVTNDVSVGDGDEVGVAFLPPTEVHGVVSQGMFLGGSEGVLTDVEAGPEGRPAVPGSAYAETRNALDRFLTD
jgi:predicted RNA-binding protein with EMAP domain